jgi:uncharacterized BrkB/YihY/UPF0761 family membrane protein
LSPASPVPERDGDWTCLVHHYLRSDSVYGVFATVLGLAAWLYLAVEVTVYAAEVNLVLVRHMRPTDPAAWGMIVLAGTIFSQYD